MYFVRFWYLPFQYVFELLKRSSFFIRKLGCLVFELYLQYLLMNKLKIDLTNIFASILNEMYNRFTYQVIIPVLNV